MRGDFKKFIKENCWELEAEFKCKLERVTTFFKGVKTEKKYF